MKRTPLGRKKPLKASDPTLPRPTPQPIRKAVTTAREVSQGVKKPRPPRKQWGDEELAANAERRFERSLMEGTAPSHKPHLGPCLIFTGPKSNGYGQFRYEKKNGYAHRYAWERENGPIPDGLTVDHLCRNRACVRVEHMELVPPVENYLRGVEDRNACPNGHSYEPGSFKMRRGVRECLECKRATGRRSYQKRFGKPEGEPDFRIRYDQEEVKALVNLVRSGIISLSEAARRIGCHPNYLGKRAWQASKSETFARDSGMCLKCGNPAQDAHHRLPRGMGGTRDPQIAYGLANLVSLCRQCHEWIEANRREAMATGWIVARTADPEQVPIKMHTRWWYLRADGSKLAAVRPEPE